MSNFRKIFFMGGVAVLSLTAAGPTPPPPAQYNMDVATRAGMAAGAANPMAMLRGGAGVSHSIDLTLRAPNAPEGASAAHAIPPGLGLGASLTLVSPKPTQREPVGDYDPRQMAGMKGRILMYWGCGEHVGPGQPKIQTFAQMATMSPDMKAAIKSAMQRGAAAETRAAREPRWPNEKDSRAVNARASLVGAHRVTSAYTPAMDFSLTTAQDFMAPLGLKEGTAMASGAVPLNWTVPARATGYTLRLSGVTQDGSEDMVMWTSAPSAQGDWYDYLSPAEAAAKVKAGRILPPSATQCILPAEVARKVPMGMVMMTGFGPYDSFKGSGWAVRLRNKVEDSLMRGMPSMGGMGAMDGMAEGSGNGGEGAPAAPAPVKKKRGFGLGTIIKNAIPLPVPIP